MIAAYGLIAFKGASELLNVESSKVRRYELKKPLEYALRFNNGILRVRTEAGFVFDGRSGPKIVDWYVPNLGSLEERVAWHMHDCLGYAQSLSFGDTNLALKFVLRDLAGYSGFKAELVRKAVSLSRSWYGWPEPGDEWYCNIDKVRTQFYANH